MNDEEDIRSILTSWGAIRLTLLQRKIVRCELPGLPDIPKEPFAILESGTDPASQYVRTLLEGGVPQRPEIGPLPGTAFQNRVWKALLEIPRGETISYASLAEKIGSASACRAVANACGKNPVPLFIPCHRIIRSDGDLGGFSAGLAWKCLLLGVEQMNR